MKRVVVLGVCAAVFIVQASWSVYTQTAKPPGPLRTERVKGDLLHGLGRRRQCRLVHDLRGSRAG